MDPQCLHIWPRRFFMMMGLANLDGGFTGTLFMPNSGEFSFDRIKDEKDLMRFFEEHFADAIPMLPDLKEQYFRNHQSSLVIVRCNPWVHKDKVALGGRFRARDRAVLWRRHERRFRGLQGAQRPA